MSYIGDYAAGDTIDFKFTTRQSTGVPTNLASGAISIYKSNSTTESTSGVTLSGSPFDSIAGLNHVRIDTTADGTFYANGSQFEAVITTGTVNAVSVVGECVGRFTLRAQASLYPTTAARTLDVTATGGAGIDWGNVENQGTTVGLTATTIAAVTAATLAAGQLFVKKNTQLAGFEFVMYADTTPFAPTDGLTVTAERSLDGGAFAACANAVAPVGSGVYKITLANTDTNATTIMLKFTATGAQATYVEIVTQA